MGAAVKQWKIRPVNEAYSRTIASAAGLPEPIARVLALRGFGEPSGIAEFLDPRLANLSDPFLLPAMDRAVPRIWRAIDDGETVAVFGDYDVDGVTAAALLTRVLSLLGAQVQPFIPDRIDEGYGLSPDALERCLAQRGATLLVSVDCGTNAVESVDSARRRGVDVIVTDHHEPHGAPAPALALINPKLGTTGGNGNLSGAGVAFKLVHALVKTGREQGRAAAEAVDLRDYLDIVALGTVADIVPLVGENRIIVRHGLAQLENSKWAGLRALKEVSGVKGPVDTYHLGFQLGPRINAAGRIGQPMEALRLLTTEDPAEARRIAVLLDETNTERRRIEKEMADAAFAEIDGYFDPSRNFGLVVARAGWHPGVVGIVASRVARHYNRPAIAMGIDEEGRARGSCRSIDEFDLLAGLDACQALLARYGGHKMAAGLEVEAGALELFKERFNAAASAMLETSDLSPVQPVDAVVSAEELDWGFYEQLKRMAPFGQDNPEPVWALLGAKVSGSPRVVGQKHLKLSLAAGGQVFDAVAFNYPLAELPAGDIDVAFTLKENRWNGSTSLQLQVQEIRASASHMR